MLNRAAVEFKIRQIVASHCGLGVEEVTLDSVLFDSEELTGTFVGSDSLDRIEIVMEVEEEFEIGIADEEAEKLQSVKDYVEYVMTNSKATK